MATHCSLHKNNYIIAAITILFFFLSQYFVAATTDINNNNGGFSAHLIRRSSPGLPLHEHKDNKVFRQLMDQNTPGYPLTTDNGEGHIFKFSIGTPPTDIYAVADTGSTLTWTQCKPCETCYKTKYAMFDPSKSSTFRNISCFDKECKLADDEKYADQPKFCKENPTGRCPYGIAYAGETTTEGVLAKETVSLTSKTGKTIVLKDVVFGCGNFQTDPDGTTTGQEMGVIGFGRGALSFVSQIAPYVGGNKFSHCLVPLDTDPKIESKINFGNGSEVLGEGVVSIPLVKSDNFKSNYVVMAQGITIGNEFVPFSSNLTSTNKMHMVVDSGTTSTLVPKHVFERVTNALNKTLDPKFEPFIVEDKTKTQHLLCLKSRTVPTEPKMTFHFEGGGKLQLVTEKMFLKDHEFEEKFCFAIIHHPQSDMDNVVIYGAIMQGNLLVGYDLDKEVVSFKPADCVNY